MVEANRLNVSRSEEGLVQLRWTNSTPVGEINALKSMYCEHVSPNWKANSMQPVKFPQMTATLAEDQPEYLPLPVWQNRVETISQWKLTWRERFKVLFTGRLWLRQYNWGSDLQPQCPQIDTPFLKVKKS